MHSLIAPIVLGRGKRLSGGLEGLEETFGSEAVSTPSGVTPHIHPKFGFMTGLAPNA